MPSAARWLQGSALTCAALLLFTGCAELEEASGSGYSPATVEEVEGADVKQVTFVADAARRVDLRTAVVRQVGEHTLVPYASLVYDAAGQVWVYTVPEPLTYMRAPVTVDRIIGDRVLLASGPAAGTRVVTVGATEVYGTELDIAGGH
jgi:hypothetical protein